jgi:hypothetical protein
MGRKAGRLLGTREEHDLLGAWLHSLLCLHVCFTKSLPALHSMVEGILVCHS